MARDELFDDLIRALSKNEGFQKVPDDVKAIVYRDLKKSVDSLPEPIQIPMFITKENGIYIAVNPVLELASQGDTEEEAIEGLKEMVKDYMEDPDTEKPEIETSIKCDSLQKELRINKLCDRTER